MLNKALEMATVPIETPFWGTSGVLSFLRTFERSVKLLVIRKTIMKNSRDM